MKKLKCGLPLLASIIVACAGAPVLAQDEAQNDPIIVSSTFTKEKLSALGTSVSLITTDQIDLLGNASITDFLRLTPSLSVATSGPLGTQSQVRIRGSEANHALVYIDGIKANDPAASSEYGFSESLSSGVSRIEVLRGSQSALYGSESIGGVISIFTASPLDDGSGSFADVSGGSFGTVQANGGARLKTEALGLMLAGGLHRTDGINISPAGTEADGSQTVTLLGKIELAVAEQSRAGFTARYVEQRSDYDDTQFFDPDTPYVVDRAGLQQRSKRFYARGYVNTAAGSWNGSAYVNIVSSRNAQRTGVATDDTDVDGGRVTLGARSGLGFASGNIDHDLTAAFESERESYSDRSRAFGGFSNQQQSRVQNSLIGQYRLVFGERLATDASFRRDWNSGFADATTWRASASVKLGAGFRAHGSAGRGITNPTFTEQFGFFPSGFRGNPILVPETATSWDAGLEWRHDWLRLDATWFQSRLKNEITTAFDSSFIASPVNESGVSRRKGIELTLDARLNHFTLSAFYSYLDAKEQSALATAPSTEVRRAKHQAALSLLWHLGAWSAAGSVSYTGKRLDDDFRGFPAQRLSLNAYALASARVSYQLLPGLDLFARIENAFDSRYQDVFGYQTSGMGVYGGLRWRAD
jgi:vitamin B12 transporter